MLPLPACHIQVICISVHSNIEWSQQWLSNHFLQPCGSLTHVAGFLGGYPLPQAGQPPNINIGTCRHTSAERSLVSATGSQPSRCKHCSCTEVMTGAETHLSVQCDNLMRARKGSEAVISVVVRPCANRC